MKDCARSYSKYMCGKLYMNVLTDRIEHAVVDTLVTSTSMERGMATHVL